MHVSDKDLSHSAHFQLALHELMLSPLASIYYPAADQESADELSSIFPSVQLLVHFESQRGHVSSRARSTSSSAKKGDLHDIGHGTALRAI